MTFTPLLFDFRPDTILKAFIICSTISGLSTAFTIEFSRLLEKHLPKNRKQGTKLLLLSLFSFFFTFFLFMTLRILFRTGGGNLSSKKPYPTLL